MRPIDPKVLQMGQKYRLSPLDILQANLLYHCPCEYSFIHMAMSVLLRNETIMTLLGRVIAVMQNIILTRAFN